MKVFTNHLITYCFITFFSFLFSQKSAAQSTVVLPGSFQSELGCPGDWMPDCNATRLTPTGPGKWEGTFLIPAGNWEYKVAYDNSWTIIMAPVACLAVRIFSWCWVLLPLFILRIPH